MTDMASKSAAPAVVWCVIAACQSVPTRPAAPPAQATAANEVTRVLLSHQDVADMPGFESRLYLIEFPPGAASKPHIHSIPGLGYVLEGSFESSYDGDAPTVTREGESFVDTPNRVHHFRNPDPARRLRFTLAGTFRKGEALFRLASSNQVRLQSAGTDKVTIARPGLYPETVELNPLTGKFLVGSIREGTVYEVGLDGAARKLIDDDRLISILGIAVDARTGRLLVTNSDLGAGLKRSARGPRKEAGVGIYDLATGRALHYVDLAPLLPDGDHLINGLTVDTEGNAYATDSFTPAIYKIDSNGVASVFLQDDEFKGAGVNLNGLVHHRKGYLLVVKKSTGALYRVPIADPRRFTRVAIEAKFIGGDGLLLAGDDRLLMVANQTPAAASNAAYVIESQDDWLTARVIESRDLGDVYPTSCVLSGGKIYALSSHLNEWIGARPEAREAIAKEGRQGELREIGVLGD